MFLSIRLITMATMKRVGQGALAVRVTGLKGERTAELFFLAFSLDAAVKCAETEGWSQVTSHQINPKEIENQPRYDLGLSWAKKAKSTGNPLMDAYNVGGSYL